MSEPKYSITDQDREDFTRRFTYHAPKGDQSPRYVLIRNDGKGMAELLYGNCPPSRERSLALTHLEQAMMWAYAAIARNE